ncbi:MAG: hypothetical protein ACFE9I_14655 [Candidatus Hermodarchaeota archaeon]
MKKSNLMKSLLILITISILISGFLPIANSNDVGIFNNIYVKHTYGISMTTEEFPSTFTWTKTSEDIFHVEWELGGSVHDTGSWDVNITSRVVSNMQDFGPDSGYHDFCWIYANVSLDDQFALFDFFKNDDTIYNITGESTYDSMAVWVLEDDYGSVLWFEKTKGFLVNGTRIDNTNWQTFEFIETNAFDPPEDTGNSGETEIPGYSYPLLIGIIASVFIILIRKQKINK